MKKVLVTGTAGFIGHHMAVLLNDHGYKVVGLDNLNSYYDPELKKHRLSLQGVDHASLVEGELQSGAIDFIAMDLQDTQAVLNLFEEEAFDVVIHLAAQPGVRYSIEHPQAYLNSNIQGFLSILEACRRYPVDHLIYASTSSVYGLNKQIPFKTSSCTDHPVSLYAATKKANEAMAHAYAHLYDIPSTGLRFFTVYGPLGRPDMAIYLFTDAIAKGKPIKVFGQGKMSRDFTYVGDIVESIRRLIDHPPQEGGFDPQNPKSNLSSAKHAVYNIGYNSPVGLMEFISEIEKNMGKEAVKQYMEMQAGDMEETYADVSDLFDLIGYQPQVSVEEGVKGFVDWYKKYNKIE